MVVDREAHWIGGASILVLDSIPKCSADRNRRLDRLPDRPHNCTRAHRITFGCTATPCFYSSEYLLHNQQRCVVGRMFWRAVPSGVAMVACGDPLTMAWSSHRVGYCSDLSDKALKPPIHRSRVVRNQSKTPANHVANVGHRVGGASRPPGLCRDPNWQLDGVEQTSFR